MNFAKANTNALLTERHHETNFGKPTTLDIVNR